MGTGLFCCILLFVCSWSSSQGPVIWTYVAECTVDKAVAISVCGLWVSAFEHVVTIQPFIAAMGLNGTLWLFAAENLCCLIFVIVFMRETKGLTQIQKKSIYVQKAAPEEPMKDEGVSLIIAPVPAISS